MIQDTAQLLVLILTALLLMVRIERTFNLLVSEKLKIPSESEWNDAFFRSVTSDELKLDQSLKAMYSSANSRV